jgi:hypothetical protein
LSWLGWFLIARRESAAITYKLQERPLGVLSKSIIRKLERLSLDSQASDAQKPARPISLKAGTRFVREWRGVTYTVLVDADGFEWNDRRYRSLTIVAVSRVRVSSV